MKQKFSLFLSLCLSLLVTAQAANTNYLSQLKFTKAPKTGKLLLKENDKLAICGDSITEQKMYSRIMETYLTVCVPELKITARQYGWGGEQADGFLNRMTNDVLRFHPTIATTCYGMNDHRYQVYEPAIGDKYRKYSTAIVEAFKSDGTRVIQGSPGCVGPKVPWAKAPSDKLNQNLNQLRTIGIEIAKEEHVAFADVFGPMIQADFAAREKFGTNYAVAGKDGVHPGWSGHLVMAYAFLKSFGLDGNIGTYTVDLKSNSAKISKGHELVSCKDGELTVKSSKFPFCATGETNSDASIRSGMVLVPFNQELNRLILIAKRGSAKNYKVTWGNETKTFSAKQLAKGVNLADEFALNPFSEAFAKVDTAVAAKQAYETKQIKQLFHGVEGKADMEGTVAKSEKERAELAAKIAESFAPVTHTIKIAAAE